MALPPTSVDMAMGPGGPAIPEEAMTEIQVPSTEEQLPPNVVMFDES